MITPCISLCFQQEDPFSNSDPFGSAFSSSSSTNKKLDAFDPFGTSGSTPNSKQVSVSMLAIQVTYVTVGLFLNSGFCGWLAGLAWLAG